MPLESSDPRGPIAVVGTYVPRRCGIATFSHDLVTALRLETSAGVSVVALNDRREEYEYGDEVRFEINERQLQDYRAAADFLNGSGVSAISLQHEFGIYGGVDGGHVLKLLSHLRAPVMTTLHTVLHSPSAAQRAIVRELGARSDRLLVMTELARGFLVEAYGIAADRIRIAPHGIPDVPFVDPNYYKDQFEVAGRKVLLTFGLLSRNKGIESVIQALPRIAQRHPEIVYIVLGTTHPNVRRVEGESYRLGLQQLARRLGVEERVLFHDRFVTLPELCEFLGTADVYVTPYLSEEQSVSGTLAYAMGAGKPIVSTNYWFAREMLADGRGALVPCGDSAAIGDAIIGLFDDETARHAMRKRAYAYTRDHVWRQVARRYLTLIDEVRDERAVQPRRARAPEIGQRFESLPDLDLSHLKRLTDDTGIAQHASWMVVDRRHGYCTDDNARALQVVAQSLPYAVDPRENEGLALRYLAFLLHGFDAGQSTIRNFMGFDRRFQEQPGSPDCQGRAVWALGEAAASFPEQGMRGCAIHLLHLALPLLDKLVDLRAIAYAQLGLAPFLARNGGDSAAKRARQLLADRLFAAFEGPARGSDAADWPWPEATLTYANALLPHALIESGEQVGRADMVERGLAALRWLMAEQTQDGRFAPIGNQGWHSRGMARARFDQQPIDASHSVLACAAALRVTGDAAWRKHCLLAFRWFLGENDVGLPLYDHATGGCRDGLHMNGVSDNEGAESTLAWLSALVQMHALEAAGQLGGRIVANGNAGAAIAGAAHSR